MKKLQSASITLPADPCPAIVFMSTATRLVRQADSRLASGLLHSFPYCEDFVRTLGRRAQRGLQKRARPARPCSHTNRIRRWHILGRDRSQARPVADGLLA